MDGFPPSLFDLQGNLLECAAWEFELQPIGGCRALPTPIGKISSRPSGILADELHIDGGENHVARESEFR
jgi:hypothetical protein